MFNSLTGIISAKLPQKLYLETHGIEWDINVPQTALDKLPPVGNEAKIYVYLQHTDALMVLYGFALESDRTLFFDLLKVDGIGPKAALKIMGNIDTSSLARLLDEGDVGALEKVPGVGKKTAAKMLLQLKGKLSLNEDNSTPASKSVPFADVVAALVSMGYDKKQTEDAIMRLNEQLKNDPAFTGLDEKSREDNIFRRAIVELAQ